jgi:hypothetical protein
VVFLGSSTNKIDHHNITEILLKVALNTNKKTNRLFYHTFFGLGNGSVVVIRLSRQWFPCNNMSYTVKPAGVTRQMPHVGQRKSDLLREVTC